MFALINSLYLNAAILEILQIHATGAIPNMSWFPAYIDALVMKFCERAVGTMTVDHLSIFWLLTKAPNRFIFICSF